MRLPNRSTLAACVAATAIATTACTNDNDPVAAVEMLDPATGEIVEVELVEAEPVGGNVNTEPDTNYPWPPDYLTATGANETDLDRWAQQACTNFTELPDSPASIAAVMVASPDIPTTDDWPRAALTAPLINRWCPDFAASIDDAVAAMQTQPDTTDDTTTADGPPAADLDADTPPADPEGPTPANTGTTE